MTPPPSSAYTRPLPPPPRFLTDKGIEYLREYLNLPADVVPATLTKSARPAGEQGGNTDPQQPAHSCVIIGPVPMLHTSVHQQKLYAPALAVFQ